ncbi:upstream-binding factor 1-like protein 1 [Cololabis saira]|uniref:upstream-binding factor 1-like protein 1 n=1 Tax=Cololabis saira TaxID=129043 RepID=UPI002AD49D21|nr:upstream-binding factor 1-like protein 1 [Cololabis saira]
MSSEEPGTAESGWTTENLQRLFTAMKACLANRGRRSGYLAGLKAVDWNKVTFPPFSAEECQQKWMEVMAKIRKTRSLTELIVEAEDVILTLDKYHPKKPAPPNATFFKENAAKFKKEHPEMNAQQLLKISNEKFKMLPVEEKDMYKKKCTLITEEYQDQKQKFCEQNPSYPSVSKTWQKKKRKVRADKEGGANEEEGFPPKPPNNGFVLFCKEQRSSTRGRKGQKSQHIKEWGRLWREMSPNQKATYIRRSNEMKKEYKTKLCLYVDRFDGKKRQQILRENDINLDTMKLKEVRCGEVLPNEPKMPPKSGSVIFCQRQMEIMKHKIPITQERFGMVNKMWSHLPAVEKEQYNNEVKDKKRKYTEELRNWFKTLTPQQQREYQESNPRKAKHLQAKQGNMELEELHLNLPSKPQYFQAKRGNMELEELHLNLPSDSEDELIEISSSEEEGNFITFCVGEDDDEDCYADDIMFEI